MRTAHAVHGVLRFLGKTDKMEGYRLGKADKNVGICLGKVAILAYNRIGKIAVGVFCWFEALSWSDGSTGSASGLEGCFDWLSD